MQTEQIKCPHCSAAAAARSDGQYVCDFCLQAFSVVEARNEEARLIDELKSWIQKLGVAPGPGSVDASSRAYIFQQKVLPELRRDVSRLLETVGTHGQHALLVAPVPRKASATGPNPLFTSANLQSGLKTLIARCESPDVSSFAVSDIDRSAVVALTQKLSETLHLMQVVRAGANPTGEGYAAAQRNLELLLKETLTATTRASVTIEERAFLTALAARYRSLVDACRLFGELVAGEPSSSDASADRAESLATAMDAAAGDLEASNWSPAETMPLVLGIRDEAHGARSVSRWLRGYEVFSSQSSITFPSFVAEMQSLAGPTNKAEDLLEAYTFVFQAARGQVAATVIENFDWVSAWTEGQRARKKVGLFGTNEEIVGIEQFLVPVWLAEVSFSRSSGKVFKSGAESKAIAIVDACAPSSIKVRVFVDGHEQLSAAMASPAAMGGRQVALPNSSADMAKKVITDGVRLLPNLLNAVVQVKGIVFLPAAVAHYSSKNGPREATTCMSDQVPIDNSARVQWQQARVLMERFA